MKKIISVVVITLISSAASHAQVQVGPFLAYGEGLGLWGLGVNTEFLINEPLSISAVFVQFFPEDLTNAPKRIAWELNTNLNYYIANGEVGSLYGLTGLNYTQIRLRDDITDNVETDGNLGLNIGLGTMFRINRVLPFAEGKYTLGGYSQVTLFLGVKFQLTDPSLEYDY